MKITPEEYEHFEKLIKKGLGTLIGGIALSSIEEAFEADATEYALLPIIRPLGMALILDHLEKKHNIVSNIFIVDHEADKSKLTDALQAFSRMNDGSSMALLVWSGGHWRTAYCERKDNKTQIAVVDSLGIAILDNPIESVVNATPELKLNTLLMRSVNRIQVDHNNCGIFALRMAQKLSRDHGFIERLKAGNLFLTNKEASDHFTKSRQDEKQFNTPTNSFFVLPPEYFSLAQRQSYLKHYKDEFGERKGVHEFEYHSRKTGKTMYIDDLFNRKDREIKLSDVERGNDPQLQNYNVLYFCNKYIDTALISVVEQLSNENLSRQDVIKRIKADSAKHMLDTEQGRDRLSGVDPRFSAPVVSNFDSMASKSDMLDIIHVPVQPDEARALKDQHLDHYRVLTAENELQIHLAAKQSPDVQSFQAPHHHAYIASTLTAEKRIQDIERHIILKLQEYDSILKNPSHQAHLSEEQKISFRDGGLKARTELESIINNHLGHHPEEVITRLYKLNDQLTSRTEEINLILKDKQGKTFTSG